ncbi:hypothetical protein BC832DRAFT_609221 [Gaertneriomyces semiglobifer]|nr:hypothetical protein BC832DRAFT_609221 [Gaertneriomyces semiglobifer]
MTFALMTGVAWEAGTEKVAERASCRQSLILADPDKPSSFLKNVTPGRHDLGARVLQRNPNVVIVDGDGVEDGRQLCRHGTIRSVEPILYLWLSTTKDLLMRPRHCQTERGVAEWLRVVSLQTNITHGFEPHLVARADVNAFSPWLKLNRKSQRAERRREEHD